MFSKLTELLTGFINLSSSKQVMYLLFGLVLVLGCLVVYFYNTRDKVTKEVKIIMIAKDNVISKQTIIIDSLKNLIFEIKVEHLKTELDRYDSLLKVSEQNRKSLDPVINKVNSKLNEISN